MTDAVEKVGGSPASRNNRIVEVCLLNQCCASEADLESILLREVRKIFFQHGVIPGSRHTQALGISSPRIDEVHLMGPCNHGEPQWSSMSDWMSHLR
jgi:hypothetical protein